MKKRILSLMLAVTLLFSIAIPANAVGGTQRANTPFTDIDGHWAKPAIEWAYEEDLVSGMTETTFAPETSMTRAMFVTILGRKSNVDKSKYTDKKTFSDVKQGLWYSEYVEWAAAYKIVSGTTATTFNPDGKISRQEMATVLFNYAYATENPTDYDAATYYTFKDRGSVAKYAVIPMQWATHHKVINGNTSGTLNPTGTATRAQVAQILYNSKDLLTKTEVVRVAKPAEPVDPEAPTYKIRPANWNSMTNDEKLADIDRRIDIAVDVYGEGSKMYWTFGPHKGELNQVMLTEVSRTYFESEIFSLNMDLNDITPTKWNFSVLQMAFLSKILDDPAMLAQKDKMAITKENFEYWIEKMVPEVCYKDESIIERTGYMTRHYTNASDCIHGAASMALEVNSIAIKPYRTDTWGNEIDNYVSALPWAVTKGGASTGPTPGPDDWTIWR